MLGGQIGPFLKKLVVGSESANNVYLEKVDVYNMYAMSESGFAVSIFLMPSMLIAESTWYGVKWFFRIRRGTTQCKNSLFKTHCNCTLDRKLGLIKKIGFSPSSFSDTRDKKLSFF